MGQQEMPTLDTLKKQAKLIVRRHHERLHHLLGDLRRHVRPCRVTHYVGRVVAAQRIVVERALRRSFLGPSVEIGE